MLDPNFLRLHATEVKELIAAGRGNAAKADIDRWLELDAIKRDLNQQELELQKQKNELAEMGKSGQVGEIRERGIAIRDQLKEIQEKLTTINTQWQQILDWTPNMPLHPEDMPDGRGEAENKILQAWVPGSGYLSEAAGRLPAQMAELMPQQVLHASSKDFTPLHHIDLGEKLGIIDNKQSAVVSGSRFTYLLAGAARLQYAIQQLMFNELLRRGFTPIIPPLLVKDRAVYGSSHLPEGRDQIYRIEADLNEDEQQLNLVGSSEPANFAYFMDKHLPADQLPIKLFAYTSCFRSEAGSWGRDTKGIKRVHQFDKIEMNAVCLPEQSEKIFDEFLSINEWLLQQLEIPYQLVLKCKGDAGYLASAKQVDAEAWLSGQKEFMEVGTDTNTTDYQARRLNIRFTNEAGRREYVHTVNDTGVAMGRMIIAILDNYQQADGSVLVPQVLRSVMGVEVLR